MATLAQRTQTLEQRTDRLESILASFMERTDSSIERLERAIERMEQEGARDREAAARDREESARFRAEMARDREEMKQQADRERREFDALYVGARAVLLNETKSSPRMSDAQAFAEFLESGEFARYFPQYRELPIVPAFSSLSIPDDMVTWLTRRGIYAIAMGDEAMQVLNLDAVRGRRAAPSEQI